MAELNSGMGRCPLPIIRKHPGGNQIRRCLPNQTYPRSPVQFTWGAIKYTREEGVFKHPARMINGFGVSPVVKMHPGHWLTSNISIENPFVKGDLVKKLFFGNVCWIGQIDTPVFWLLGGWSWLQHELIGDHVDDIWMDQLGEILRCTYSHLLCKKPTIRFE